MTDSVSALKQALGQCPPGHPDRAEALDKLGRAFRAGFTDGGRLGDLTSAIECFQESVQLCPPGHPIRAVLLDQLAEALHTRSEEDGDPTDLESSIAYYEQVLLLRPSDMVTLNNLANAVTTRYERLGHREDLDRALAWYHGALEGLPPEDRRRMFILSNLGGLLLTRFENLGNRDDLNNAIACQKDALDLCPPGHPERSLALNNLGNAFFARFKEVGDHIDLNSTIECHEEALALRPPGHPRRSSSLDNLATALKTRFDQGGDLSDVHRAITLSEEALILLPKPHPKRAGVLNNLATAIVARFHQLGDRKDLDNAISYNQEVLALRPPGHPYHNSTLNNLANALSYRFRVAQDLTDLNSAISYLQEALGARSAGQSDRPMLLHNLAGDLLTRFKILHDPTDLDSAIAYGEEALENRPPGHPYRLFSLNNLSNTVHALYETSRNVADLNRSIAYLREGLDLCPSGHHFRASLLYNMVESLRAELDLSETGSSSSNTAKYKKDILEALMEASADENGHLFDRLDCALAWASFARQEKEETALGAYRVALELLDTSVTIARDLEMQHARLAKRNDSSDVRGLASDAAALAIDQQQARLAVELLEQGRGILFAQLGRYRTPLDELRAVDGDLASEFAAISSQLEGAVQLKNGQSGAGDDVGRYQSLTRQWQDIIRRIRDTSGFTNFLQPTPFPTLVQAANDGPVIVVNISQYRSDAIILRKDTDPEVVHLPKATKEEVQQISVKLEAALAVVGKERTMRVQEILRLLWDVVVSPVVDQLKSMKVAPGSRVWWCPTSLLCSLPLHAAGIYRDGGAGSRLPDTFISSYTPTLSALIRARREQHRLDAQPGVLAVGVAKPAGMDGPDGALASVTPELDQVSKHAPTDRPLSLHEIVQVRLPNAELAFLSACQSATGDRSAPDEVLHLASALQFVGFRSAIGTLWAMDDADGPDVAEAFYKYMFRAGGVVDFKDAAKGLFHVTKALRQKKVPLDRWVNFVHVGA